MENLEDELRQLEKKRGYVMGAADRVRLKAGMKSPCFDLQIALIRENLRLEELRGKRIFSEPAVQNFTPQPKAGKKKKK